mgnify:CR=1 FL=1
MSTAATNITTIKTPNPQGKGLSTTLSDWQYFSPQQHQDRPAERLFADYFTSTLVLSAEFGFKPVINQQYYLYHQNKYSKEVARTCHQDALFQCILTIHRLAKRH